MLKIFEPDPGFYVFYDGRVPGERFAEEDNWVDAGALALGIASFAFIDAGEAVVYDAHATIDRAHEIRRFVEQAGATRITLVLSHWHPDHIAGNAAFADCEIVANERTAQLMRDNHDAIVDGSCFGPPGIDPLVGPNQTFSGSRSITAGTIELELHHYDIHSDDETVLWWPAKRTLLAGDTLEDTVTYVTEPDRLEVHLRDLARLREFKAERILPNHGDPEIIAGSGYTGSFIDATEDYVAKLIRSRDDEQLRAAPLSEWVEEHVRSGAITYFDAYEEVHAANLAALLKS